MKEEVCGYQPDLENRITETQKQLAKKLKEKQRVPPGDGETASPPYRHHPLGMKDRDGKHLGFKLPRSSQPDGSSYLS